jgi:hypothetical protein
MRYGEHYTGRQASKCELHGIVFSPLIDKSITPAMNDDLLVVARYSHVHVNTQRSILDIR